MSSTIIKPKRDAGAPEPARPRRTLSRAAFYVHLWAGVLTTVALIAISVTGILLNHKRGLGLMPDVAHEPEGAFGQAKSLEELTRVALHTVDGDPGANGNAPVDIERIDRMDVRPRSGFVKVRMRDKASTEVTVDLTTGRVLHMGRRGDVFLEKLHSGEAFGGPMIILSDIAAVCLVLTLITGYWLWLVPKLTRAARQSGGEAE